MKLYSVISSYVILYAVFCQSLCGVFDGGGRKRWHGWRASLVALVSLCFVHMPDVGLALFFISLLPHSSWMCVRL